MKVAYFILNSFEFDTRARLEVEAISNLGHDVDIIVTVGSNEKSFLNSKIHRIKQNTWPNRKIRFIQYNINAAKIGAGLKADVYHAVDVDVLAAAYWGAKKSNGKLIYEARELYTELEPLQGRNAVKKFWSIVEGRLIIKADYVFTINESIALELERRYSIRKPDVIRNVAVSKDDIVPVDLRKKYNIPEDHKVIICQGVLRSGQGLDYAFEIMKELNNTVLILFGSGHLKEHLKSKRDELNLSDIVIFAGQVPPAELLNYTAGADAGLLLMEDAALNNKLALPQKLFQYLTAGIPQIVSPMPEISKFVVNENCGIVVQLGNPAGASESIMKMISDPERLSLLKSNCRKSARTNNWENESQKLIDIYNRLEKEI